MAFLLSFFEGHDLGVEARFFLQAMASRGGIAPATPFKIKPVAKLLCLTERLVRDAVHELVEAELLVAQKQADKVGRPGQEYQASQYLLDLLARSGRGSLDHQELIHRLFSESEIYAEGPRSEVGMGCEVAPRKLVRKDGRPAAPGAHGRLGASTRVLLASLLSFADQCGVVAGVGEARLRAMTGLNPAALKHQVRRLVSLGYIRGHVPGVSNGVFIGAKVPSTYYLNLDHPQLGEQRSRRAVLVYAAAGPSLRERLVCGLNPEVASALLALGPAVLNVLCHKLARYTSHLLSLTWGSPGERYGDAPASMEGMIARELGQLRVSGTGLDKDGYYWPGMLDHFFAVAFEWAEELKVRLNGKAWSGYQPQLIRLIPAPEQQDGLRITSLIFYPAPERQEGCIVCTDVRGGFLRRFDSEADLDVRNRYEFGLLTE
jgi:hypothetical protein